MLLPGVEAAVQRKSQLAGRQGQQEQPLRWRIRRLARLPAGLCGLRWPAG